jgi:hypothetical protein
MNWKDKTPLISERLFGMGMGLVLAAWAFLLYPRHSSVGKGFFVLAAFLFFFGIFWPKVLRPLNKAWAVFAHFNAHVIGALASVFVFILVLVPMGFLLRLSGKDFLRLKKSGPKESDWILREGAAGSMRDQF